MEISRGASRGANNGQGPDFPIGFFIFVIFASLGFLYTCGGMK